MGEDVEVNIALLPAENVTVEDGFATFTSTRTGLTDSVIDRVNGVNRTNPTDLVVGVGTVEDAEITFRINYTGEIVDDVVPVVWLDDDNSNRLELDADGAPTEDFGVGGDTLWLPPEAEDGDTLTGTVLYHDADQQLMVLSGTSFASLALVGSPFPTDITEAKTFFYDADDDLRYNNEFGAFAAPQSITIGQFESYLSSNLRGGVPADFINADARQYSTTSSNEFVISGDIGSAPANLEVELGDFGGAGDLEDAQLTWDGVDDLWLRNYIILIDDAPAEFQAERDEIKWSGDDSSDLDDSTEFVLEDLPEGKYVVLVGAQSHTMEIGGFAEVEFTVGPEVFVVRPFATYAAVTDAGTDADFVEDGDEFTYVIYDTEPAETVIDSDARLRVNPANDAGNSAFDFFIQRGVNSTWDITNDYGDDEGTGTLITITMTDEPEVGPSDDRAEYPLSILGSDGIADEDDNELRVSGVGVPPTAESFGNDQVADVTNAGAFRSLGYQGDTFVGAFTTATPGEYRVRIKGSDAPTTSFSTLGTYTTAQVGNIATPESFLMGPDGSYDIQVLLTDPAGEEDSDIGSGALVVGGEGVNIDNSPQTATGTSSLALSGLLKGSAASPFGIDSLECTITDGDDAGQSCEVDAFFGGDVRTATFEIDFSGSDFDNESTVAVQVDMVDGAGNSFNASGLIEVRAPVMLLSADPVARSTGDAHNTSRELELTWNTAVELEGNADSITIVDSGDNPGPNATVVSGSGTTTWLLELDDDLVDDETYTVQAPTGVAESDVGTLNRAGDSSVDFNTIPAETLFGQGRVTAPVVESIVPQVDTRTALITFDRPINASSLTADGLILVGAPAGGEVEDITFIEDDVAQVRVDYIFTAGRTLAVEADAVQDADRGNFGPFEDTNTVADGSVTAADNGDGTATLTATVTDMVGDPVLGLAASDFETSGTGDSEVDGDWSTTGYSSFADNGDGTYTVDVEPDGGGGTYTGDVAASGVTIETDLDIIVTGGL